MKKLSIILLFALLLINIQCGGGNDKGISGTTPVSIKVTEITGESRLGEDQLSGAVTTSDLASAVEQGAGEGRQLSLCRITITGSGMTDIVHEADIAGKSSIRVTINVPSGINRSFLIQMFIENNDTVIYQASSEGHNLEGEPLEIQMEPTIQADYYEPPEFSGILSVNNSETRSVLLNWRPATDNITDQKRMQYLIYLTTQVKRDQNLNDIFKAYDRGTGTIREEDPLLKYTYAGDEQFISYEYEGVVPEDENTLPGVVSHRLNPGVPYFFIVRASDEWGNEEENLVESDQIVVYMLDVEVQGSGTVTSEPKGIDCRPMCSEDFLTKKEIKLTARADDGAVFNGWSGQCFGTGDCTFILSQNESVTASFTAIDSCINGDVDCSILNDACNIGECDENTGDCIKVPANEGQECNDGQYCTEGETCQNGTCTGNPRICTDGVGCTDDTCDEANDSCLNTPNDSFCPDNGQFCDGSEICDPVNDCMSSGDPCLQGETCDESEDICIPPPACGNGVIDLDEECDDGLTNGTIVCGCQTNCAYAPVDSSCSDGAFCNGEETCDGAGTCRPGTPVDCSDGVNCTDDSCDEINDTCLNVPNNANCQDNGQFCDGNEICDPVYDCISSGNPCPQGEKCDEASDTCKLIQLCGNGVLEESEECDDGPSNGSTVCGCRTDCTFTTVNSSCADGAFCNGEETCDGTGTCRSGTSVDCSSLNNQCNSGICDEKSAMCKAVPSNEGKGCDDGKFCTSGDTCQNGFCTGGGARNCSDDIGCTVDLCDEAGDKCINTPNDGNCNDGKFCNGEETCSKVNDCQPGSPPCPDGTTCNESSDTCPVDCTDEDDDGYSIEGGTCGPVDCNDKDNTIYPGATEKCDGKDNDCNSNTADGSGESWYGDACDGKDSDLCKEGKYQCTDGTQTCSDTSGSNKDICDGKDNDCNSNTADGSGESWYGDACDGKDSDLCKEGKYQCTDGIQTCSDTSGSTKDICDGKDNDCNSNTADGSGESWYGDACDGKDSDLCKEGKYQCTDGIQTCSDTSGSTKDICDGKDNDCNSNTADGSGESWYGDACDGKDSDLCKEGKYQCTDGIQTCSDTSGSNKDICDGKDNDCNSNTADGSGESWYGDACDGKDSDLCKEGKYQCTDGTQTCSDYTGSSKEICDGKDNDCDSSTDEGCDDDNDNYCDADMTVIGSPGTCTAGGGDCNDKNKSINPGAQELCDGTDNDCDPYTVDGLGESWYGTLCDGDDSDMCLEGKWKCSSFGKVCTDYSGNNTEICNDNIDNDCDGKVDEGCNFVLTITTNGYANVTSKPGSINCGYLGNNCSEKFSSGTSVWLSHTCLYGMTFVWEGDKDCSDNVVFMNRDITCKAVCTIY